MGLRPRDSDIVMFIKDENIDPRKKHVSLLHPRAIQYRGKGFCVAISRFLGPIEHQIYALSGGHSGFPASRMVGKGLNQIERAKLLRMKWASLKDPVCVVIDASRFDQHVSLELLEIEHGVYLFCCPNKEFEELCRLQLINRGRTRSGFRYVTRGKRMSGDMNTALGNCLLMIIMVHACCTHLGMSFDLLDDGDDCIVLLEREFVAKFVAEAPSVFLSFGHEIKLEQICDEFPRVSWCQSSPIEIVAGHWKFVRDPFKCMSCDLIGPKWRGSVQTRRRLLSSIGICELVLNLGVPVLQNYALALLRASSGARPFDKGDFFASSLALRLKRELKSLPWEVRLCEFNLEKLRKINPQPITEEARLSFQRAFDVSVDEQLSLEQQLDQWTISLVGDVFQFNSWDPTTGLDFRVFKPERYL
jgi:hypothetical protein